MNQLQPGRRALLSAAALLAPGVAWAQDTWPGRPVRIVVPYAPGGGTDITSRAIAEALTKRFGQTFVVENRPGANGVVGTEQVSRTAPDGYTFVAQTATHIMARQMQTLPYDPVTDFTAIALLARYPLVLMASNRAPFRDLASLIAAARANPGGIAQGTSDAQSSFTAALFAKQAGIELNEVPYRGSGAYLADLTAGHLPVAWGSPATAAALTASGQIRLIGVSSRDRSLYLPDVPTLREAGVQGAEFDGWVGLFAPARLPEPIARQMNQAINEAMATPEMQARYRTLGNEVAALDLEQLAALMREDDARWAEASRNGLIRRSS
ncbi:tripartite tricarboxylate transporter substrate binding protein [Neoroseomonas oryzicola]|uniref:Tripartite tricarboxylate transporter substrate binding protein n=1 Tax=Neoroseomonas oryzicola TaxID=535904 RepID=A0A9X9WF85_9PROT|nr:tripartite tricarboxylate transporter substrate binding protein [Neoroseomonas oryzicola]MBR0658995.1 tripartite tricarboxylate transporter substrate binding protein [Neoroseomonas oryzicola]NKE19729.1 tripartite tricarboxylate transporter substrate binding protein [Neoroseomonas oryzicola]